MLEVPFNASSDLKLAIETIIFLLALPDDVETEVGSVSDSELNIYRTQANTIVVHYYGSDSQLSSQIAEAVRLDGYIPLKVSRHGLHFSTQRAD